MQIRRQGRWPGLVVLASAWVGGGGLALAGPHLLAMPLLVAATVGALLLSLRDRRATVLLIAALGASWTTYAAGRAMANRLPFALEKQTLIVTGTIASLPRVEPGRLRFPLVVATADVPSGKAVRHPRRIALSWYRPPPDVHPRVGERWRLAVRLRRPRSLADPGAFDYAGWALANGIGAGGYVYHDDARRLARAGVGLGALRARIARAIDAALPNNSYAGLIAGLTVGEQSGVTEKQWQTLRATGTTHLLSISGLHLALGSLLVYFLALLLFRRIVFVTARIPARIPAAAAAALAAIGYGALAGFAMATERSLVMLTLPLLAITLRRRIPIADALALAAVIVVAVSPLALITASFWLSFGAVAALVYGLASARPGWGLVRAQFAVSLAIVPLTIAFFGQMSLVGPLANLLAIPVVSWLVVPPALLGVVAQLIHGGWGAPFFQAGAFVLSLLWLALEWLAALPHAHFVLGAASLPALIAALLGAALLLAPRGLGLKFAGLVLFLPLLLPPSPRPASGDFRVTVLDVGQGLAAVVTTEHHLLLVDSGPRWWGGNDAGREIVLPFLRAHRLGRPDLVVLSHLDSDHSGGLRSIRRAWPGLPVLSSAAKAQRRCRRGEHWTWDGVRFAVLAPPAGADGSRNNRSCVLKVTGAGGSALFPGDIEAPRERWLLAHERTALASDLLVAPHHGSKTSSTAAFVRAVHPRFAVFAIGYLNRYHFPDAAVIERYRALGTMLLDSAHDGAIRFEIGGNGGVKLTGRYRLEHRRAWTDP